MEGGEASPGGALSPAPGMVGGRMSRAHDVVVREASMGDLAAVVCQQAALYRDEFHYGPVFEDYLLAGAARFVQDRDGARDRLWVAQEDAADGNGLPQHPVGAIAVQHVADRPGWAQLRWFVVDARWRGKGLGRRLMTQALSFARQAGYQGILLWTVDDLRQAARVYEGAGFRLAHHDQEPCRWAPWGHEQRWERLL